MAPTVALKAAGAPTQPGGTVSLPKATVQLKAPTQSATPTSPGILTQTPTLGAAEEEEAENPLVLALAVAGLLGAAAVFAIQAMAVSIWDGWGQLF